MTTWQHGDLLPHSAMQYSLIPVTVTYTGTLEIPQLCPQNRADCMWEHADWYGTCTIGSPSSRENAFVLRYTTGVLSISPLKGFFPQFELVLSPVLLLAHVLLPLCVCSRDKDKDAYGVRVASSTLHAVYSFRCARATELVYEVGPIYS